MASQSSDRPRLGGTIDSVTNLFDGTDRERNTWRMLFIGVPVLYLLVFLVLGLVFIGVISFWTTDQYVLIPTWTVSNYVTIATSGTYTYFIGKSLLMAVLVTATCLLVGYPVAYYIERALKTHQQLTVLLLIATPFFVGTLVRVFAHQGLIGPTGLLNMLMSRWGAGQVWIFNYGNFQTFIGEVYLWLPFMILSVFLSLQNIDFNQLEAAHDAGAGRLRAFYEVTWPLSRPGVVVGSILVFIPTLSGNITPEFVGGPNGTLIGNIIHSHFGESGEWAFGAALSMTLILISAVFIAALVRTINWRAYDFGGGDE